MWSPGIDDDDDLLLWGGGVYNWFDPQTLVRAVGLLRLRRPNVRLYFLGMKHPNAEVPQMRVATETMALADELGPHGHARVLQPRLGALRVARRLAARGRHRREHAPRPRRDRVLVPDPGARLPLGRRCRSCAPPATRWRTSSTSTASAPRCRPAIPRPSPRRSATSSTIVTAFPPAAPTSQRSPTGSLVDFARGPRRVLRRPRRAPRSARSARPGRVAPSAGSRVVNVAAPGTTWRRFAVTCATAAAPPSSAEPPGSSVAASGDGPQLLL